MLMSGNFKKLYVADNQLILVIYWLKRQVDTLVNTGYLQVNHLEMIFIIQIQKSKFLDKPQILKTKNHLLLQMIYR
jgi:hypothetical protein